MTSLIGEFEEDLTEAIKGGDEARRDTLRLILSELRLAEKELQRPLDESEELQVLQRERKKRVEAAQAFRDAGRDEQADQEENELEVIEDYMPEPISEDELEADRRRRDRRDGCDVAAGSRSRDGRRHAAGRRPRGRVDGQRVRAREARLARRGVPCGHAGPRRDPASPLARRV